MPSTRPRQLVVRDLMTAPVRTLSAGQSVSAAELVMERKRVRHLPVIDERERVVGLVTHRDLLRAQGGTLLPVDAAASEERALRVPVSAIMQTEVWTIAPTAPALSAARLLRDHRFGCLPVVERGRLIGIVTEADFIELVVDSLELGPPPHASTMGAVMSLFPETVRITDTLGHARERMEALGIRHLPVVDEAGAPQGLLSERDLRVAEAIVGRDSDVLVGAVGSEPPYVVSIEAEVGPVLLDLATRRIGSAMVVADGELVGIFTTTDACRILGERLYPGPSRGGAERG